MFTMIRDKGSLHSLPPLFRFSGAHYRVPPGLPPPPYPRHWGPYSGRGFNQHLGGTYLPDGDWPGFNQHLGGFCPPDGNWPRSPSLDPWQDQEGAHYYGGGEGLPQLGRSTWEGAWHQTYSDGVHSQRWLQPMGRGAVETNCLSHLPEATAGTGNGRCWLLCCLKTLRGGWVTRLKIPAPLQASGPPNK